MGDLADLLLYSRQRALDPTDPVAICRVPRLRNPVQVLAAHGPRYVVRPDMHPRLTILQPRHFAFVSVFRCFEVLRFKTRFVNPLRPARPIQRLVCLIRPVLAGLL